MRSELGRIWPPPPLAGRGPNPPASPAPGGTGWRPSRGQLRRPVRGANSDSPSEPSLANSGAIRSDGRKNPSVGFLRPQKSERLLR